jgi:hypothetical protein
VYQRRAFEGRHGGGGKHDRHHSRRPHWQQPQVNAGWYQRPYPYHLDYYKMRYGGSYAPYFGNLYGTPQVVTAPPYYGPYYGGYEGAPGYGGFGGQPAAGPYGGAPMAPFAEGPVQQTAPATNDELPAP